MNIDELVASEETNTREYWMTVFETHDIPFPTSATYETFEEWKNEFAERSISMDKVNNTIELLEETEFAAPIDGDYSFNKVLKILDYCDIVVDNWMELCDNVDEDFFTLSPKVLMVTMITITTNEEDDYWNIELTIHYGEEPVFCTFHVDDEQLYAFLFQCFQKNIIR